MKRVTQHGKNLITHNNEGKIKTFVKKKHLRQKTFDNLDRKDLSGNPTGDDSTLAFK